MPPGRAATTDVEWDFSDFVERVTLNGELEAPTINYNGMQIVGAVATDNKDYVAAEGVHYNGATKAGQRYIHYMPDADGRLTVSYKSNGSGARGCYISEENSTTNYLAMDSAVVGSVVARLKAGRTYYICCDAGITITNILYSPY